MRMSDKNHFLFIFQENMKIRNLTHYHFFENFQDEFTVEFKIKDIFHCSFEENNF